MPTSNLIQLNSQNYYDADTDWQYMSVSLFKDFMKCEASALDKLKSNKLADENATPLIVGNYVHSYFESPESHATFIESKKDLITTRSGSLRSEYKLADKMIERLKNSEFFNWLYQGKKEAIVTGDLFGTRWKGKIDCLDVENGRFIDLKTSADLNRVFWSKRYGGKVLWLQEYGYIMQMSIYKHLLEQQYKKKFDPIIFAVSKTDPVGIQGYEIYKDPDLMELEDAYVQRTLPRVLKVIHGEVAPTWCHKCDWCKEHQLGQNMMSVSQATNIAINN
ncbi:PD-(D/E)XK nuclease-like domain-containing protein [Lapidilactobacillus gannanensis]|uniref:PD-(D/E)XK nuclease-like domain-containing protein n=1 Tax=Lapidilactobacillus gannanensis TaxID=2486002 RepID=A0ABW4BPA2_9LACO|nr:PD-(D/E)XK nuclease-like domain-containing protein [Lapidilactobacillus gannanensis]